MLSGLPCIWPKSALQAALLLRSAVVLKMRRAYNVELLQSSTGGSVWVLLTGAAVCADDADAVCDDLNSASINLPIAEPSAEYFVSAVRPLVYSEWGQCIQVTIAAVDRTLFFWVTGRESWETLITRVEF